MRRVFAIAVAALLCTSLHVSAMAEGEQSQPKIAVSAPGVFPIVKDKLTISVAGSVAPTVEDLETNELTLWYEEKTNVHVDWIQIPRAQFTEKVSIMLAGGDLPDAITSSEGFTKATLMLHGAGGLFLPLNDYVDRQAKELKGILDANPGIRRSITAPDGHIYAMPNLSEAFHTKYMQKMWVYRPWLEKLGLAMPTTTEAFHDMLVAFKTRDPNRNGKADEIPLAACNVATSREATIHAFLMNSFVYTNVDDYLILKNGTIGFAPIQPEWRDGLRYLKRLYDEGLIYPGSFTQDRSQYRQLGENPDAVILGAGDALYAGMFAVIAPGGRWLDYEAVAPLAGPSGVRQTAPRNFPVIQLSMVITKAATHPEVVAKWADFFYSLEGTLSAFYGRWGKGIRQANAGEVGIDGKPARWMTIVGWGDTQNICWRGMVPCNSDAAQRLSQVAAPGDLEVVLYREAKEKYEPYGVYETVPDFFLTADQAVTVSEIKSPLMGYVDEAIARFITGDLNLDTDWNAYLQEIDKIGLKRYLEVLQGIYDKSPYAKE